jgi:3-dehydroquinate synthase
MGVGKTTIGQELADKLNMRFIDLDHLIRDRVGKPIPEIFYQDGEIAFRELEIEVTREVSRSKKLVIACGGGIVLNKINIDRLKEDSVIVYLTASPRVILKRTSVDKNGRSLLNVSDRIFTIRELLKFRKPFYQRAADITINTSRQGINTVTK